MSDFDRGTALKKPVELTKKRHVSSQNQLSKDDAKRLADKYDVVWGPK